MGNLEIIEYTKQDLKNLLLDVGFWMRPRLPITKRRIISQLSNPRAEDSDVVLITAFSRGQLVAYVGILPDRLMGECKAPTKFGWLTTWWVDKGSENRLAATIVLFAAMKRYANRIAASSPSSDAERVYAATKRFRTCVRFDRSYFIIALPPSFRILGPMIRRFAGAKNRITFCRQIQRRGLEIRPIDGLDEASKAFINAWAARDPLARDASYWEWVLKFPWVSASTEDQATQTQYAFSVFAKEFRQIPLLVNRHGTVIAFLAMTLRDGRLSLKYAYYDPLNVADVAAAVQLAIADINPWLFVCADSSLNAMLKQDVPFYLATQSKPSAIYTAKVLPLSFRWQPQFGTGDSIFT